MLHNTCVKLNARGSHLALIYILPGTKGNILNVKLLYHFLSLYLVQPTNDSNQLFFK